MQYSKQTDKKWQEKWKQEGFPSETETVGKGYRGMRDVYVGQQFVCCVVLSLSR